MIGNVKVSNDSCSANSYYWRKFFR